MIARIRVIERDPGTTMFGYISTVLACEGEIWILWKLNVNCE